MQIPTFDKFPIDEPAMPEAWDEPTPRSGAGALVLIAATVAAASFCGTALALWVFA